MSHIETMLLCLQSGIIPVSISAHRNPVAHCPAGRSIRPQTCSCREHDNRANFTKDPHPNACELKESHSENPQNKILSEVSTNGALLGEVCWPKRIYSNFRETVLPASVCSLTFLNSCSR